MATGRQLVSNVRSMHRLLSSDNRMTDRVILSEIKINTFLFLKRETNLRKLWATDTIFTTIPCLELMEVPISECCEFADECTIARTKFKLPPIAQGNYQYVIQGVYSINAMGGKGVKMKEITINRYLNLLKLPLIKKEIYFWINNGYLYITNPLIQSVRISALFEEDVPNEIMYPECGCGNNVSEKDLCLNPLDKPFPLPGYLEKQVLDETSKRLLSTYFRLKQDLTSNDVDGTSPNSPINA